MIKILNRIKIKKTNKQTNQPTCVVSLVQIGVPVVANDAHGQTRGGQLHRARLVPLVFHSAPPFKPLFDYVAQTAKAHRYG